MADDRLIDEAVEQLVGSLHLTGAYRRRVREELSDHVHDVVDDLTTTGLRRQQAIELAVQRLGPHEALAAEFVPRATRTTRLAGISFFAGLVVVFVAVRAANALHARDQRLGADLAYTASWLLGWIGLLLIAAQLLAIIGGQLRRLHVAGWITVTAGLVAAGAGVLFHLTNDGTINDGPAGWIWQLAMVIGVAVACCALFVVIRHRRLDPRPVAMLVIGSALLVGHYTILEQQGPAAWLGVSLIAVGVAWLALDLAREQPLA